MKKLIISVFMLPVAVLAQDDLGKPVVVGGFENTGSITTGYRLTNVSGYRPNY
jgi:hypothetical protein